MKRQNKKKENGFTLIELLVSLGIIALMTGIFLANYHTTDKRSELVLAAQKFASDIRLAQSYSLGSLEFGSGNVPEGGWGVYAGNGENNYIIFADDNENFSYDVGEENESQGGKIINLPSNITISSVDYEIVFEPPDPTTYINGLASGQAEIELTNGASIKKVIVNFFGLIEVTD
ncbi:MAG: prepilin-type N-terminal cleavage/methylation domain-containing protein [Patescibacteria group bacterium]